jgi:hypothetical protein
VKGIGIGEMAGKDKKGMKKIRRGIKGSELGDGESRGRTVIRGDIGVWGRELGGNG